MHFHATVTLTPLTLTDYALDLHSSAAHINESRPLAESDYKLFADWATRHRKLADKRKPSALLDLGREIFQWLDGASHFLRRLTDSAQPPLLLLFAAPREDTPQSRAFLDAPWELLADSAQHWALRDDLRYCPIRRLGAAGKPDDPSPHRLNVLFMAAAPRGADNLAWEAEESAILTSTQKLGLDLFVEESGELDLLSAAAAREKPDVVQISCHGKLNPDPILWLETDTGDPDPTPAPKLIQKLASAHPRLLFLSACETAQSDPVLPSLARSLVRSGAPAVIGWAAPVLDNEAATYAACLHEHLAKGEDLAHAHAFARADLKFDWHLARLYLSPAGGGPLATAGGPKRAVDRGRAAKTFLDVKGKQVPVAGPLEFVGRRREIQAILREFRAPTHLRHTGVLIHGLGRQGKSSLAARVAHRLEQHGYETVVVYGRYDARGILGALRDRLASPAVTAIMDRNQEPSQLFTALTEILEGPCRQKTDHTRPVLLILDDFEQAIDEEDKHSLKPDLVEPIRALLKAFNEADTDSRLLFTSRYEFTLPDGTHDLAERLLPVPLHGMDSREGRKQAAAKLRVEGADRRRARNIEELNKLIDQIVSACLGNPGLQNLLFSLGLEDLAACERCLAQMKTYSETGAKPTDQKLSEFLENLTINALLKLLTPSQRELLRSATLFDLPVPRPVWERLGSAADVDRLIALGLCEVYDDLYEPLDRALAINAIVRPQSGSLSEAERKKLAAQTVGELFTRWGGAPGGNRRRYVQDYELTRLSLFVPEPGVFAATGAVALRYLDDRFEYLHAAQWAKQIVSMVDDAKLPASVDLLRTAAERCQQIGEVNEAAAFRERALAEIDRRLVLGEQVDPEHHAAALGAHARALVDQGRPDEAIRFFEQARGLFPGQREKAITLGDIARLRADQGEVEEALRLHQEELTVYEALGDKQERAITLGDIARLRADNGEVEEALLLHQEALTVYEALGDKHSRAITLGDVARLRADNGEVEEALLLHQERLTVHEALGDKRSRAITLGDIARLRADKGEVEEALRLHQEALAVYEALGNKRSRAVTLGDIARLRAAKGEVDQALLLHQEALTVYEALGDKRERAVTLGDIARLRAAKGDVHQALLLHEERLDVYRTLGDQDGVAAALFGIAQIDLQQQRFQEAAERLAESYAICDQTGRLDFICHVGLLLGQILCWSGHADEGRPMLARSRDGFLKLGQPNLAKQAQDALDKCAD